ncbi:hypothetical protein D3C72_749500 [compost metagenome]
MQQLAGAFHLLAGDDLRHAQVDLREIIDRDGVANRLDAGRGALGALSLASRSRGGLERVAVGGHQRLDLLGIDAGHQVGVRLHRAVGRQLLVDGAPVQRLDVQEALHARGHGRHHRLQVDRQQAEGFQRDRAGRVQGIALRLVLGQLPRLVGVHEAVHGIGQLHHQAQCLAVLAALVEGGQLRRGLAQLHQQRVAERGLVDLAIEALDQEARRAAGDVHVLADQVAVHAGDEVVQVQVQVFHARVELGREVVAQPFRVHAGVDIALRRDEGAARLAHLGAIHGQEAVREDVGRRAVAREAQHRRPEQRVEVQDVLADEVVLLGGRMRADPGVEVDAPLLRQVLEAGVVADRRVQPDVEVLAGGAGDLEAEVGRVARDVPVGQGRGLALAAQPFLHLVGGLGLRQVGHPLAQEGLAARIGQLEEEVRRRLAHRRGARHHRVRVLQVGRHVSRAAHLARVAVLVLGAALRAFALDEAVRQEHVLDRVEELLDIALGDQVLGLQGQVDLLAQLAVFFRVGAVVVVERHQEAVEIALVLGPDAVDQLFRADAFLLGAQHDRRAVGVVGAHVIDLVAHHALEPDPDVGLDVLHQVADVDLAVGVRQGGCDEDATCGHEGGRGMMMRSGGPPEAGARTESGYFSKRGAGASGIGVANCSTKKKRRLVPAQLSTTEKEEKSDTAREVSHPSRASNGGKRYLNGMTGSPLNWFQENFDSSILGAAGLGGVVRHGLALATALGAQAVPGDASVTQVRRHALGAALRELHVVVRVAGAVRVAYHVGNHVLVLAQGLRHLVEHRAERWLDARAVRIERHLARDIHLERAVRLLGDLGACARRVLVQLAADGIPVVAGGPAHGAAHRRAHERASGVAADQVAQAGTHGRAHASADRGMGLLLRGATGQGRGNGERDGDKLESHAFSF